IDIRLSCTKVSTLNGVVEETVDAVTVILVVLRCINPPLRSDAMCATRTILKTECLNIIPEFSEARSGRGPAESSSDYEDLVLSLVCWVYKLDVETSLIPLLLNWPRRDICV